MAKRPVRNRVEWISLGISLTLLAGVIAAVISLWLNPSLKPAQFTLERGEIRKANNQYYLPITITNEGDATAAQVTVEGTLDTTTPEQTSSTTFDFVPARSMAEGVLVFDHEPTSAILRVASYQKP